MILLLLLIVISIFNNTNGAGFHPIQVMCEVNGHLIPAMIDTGAEITVMSSACARRCRLSNLIDDQHSGKAIGVGFSDIIGGIEGLGMRIGPLNFQNKVSILRHSRCDFLIGLDVLRRFNSEISLKDRILKLNVRGEEVRIPIVSSNQREIRNEESEYTPTTSQSKPKMRPLYSAWVAKREISKGVADSPEVERRMLNTIKATSIPSNVDETDDFIDEEENDMLLYQDENISLEGV